MPNFDSIDEKIEPGCDFGYIVADALQKQTEQIDDIHEVLFRNGYVMDIKELRNKVESIEENRQDSVDFWSKVKIAGFSALFSSIVAPLVVFGIIQFF